MSTMTLPSVDSTQKNQRALKPVAKSPDREQNETIVDEPTGYVRRRVDVKMPRKHAMVLHNKLRELQDAGARLSDGTEVSDHTKAVLWVLENLVQ